MEEFMAGLGAPKADPLEANDPFASKEEEPVEEVVEEEEDDKPLPFHKHPKVLRFIEKEVAKRTPHQIQQELRPSQGDEDEVTAVLERIIGNDTPEKQQAVKDFRKVLGSLEEKGAQRAIQQLQEQAEQERQEEIRAQEELDEGFDSVEETFGVDLSSNTPQARKTRSEFVDYIRKIAPKNEDGEVSAFPDLTSAFETFQELQKRAPTTSSRAKELASKGMARSSDATVAPAQTAKNWKSIDKLFSNLTN